MPGWPPELRAAWCGHFLCHRGLDWPQPQRDVLSIPVALIARDSTEAARTRALPAQATDWLLGAQEVDAHLLPTFGDTANCVRVDKAGLDVKILDFPAK